MYIGKTEDYDRRIQQHQVLLKNGKHYNALMQADYNTYGKSSFTYTLLEKVVRSDPVRDERGKLMCFDALREKETMKQYKSYLPEFGYNCKDNYFCGRLNAEKRNAILLKGVKT